MLNQRNFSLFMQNPPAWKKENSRKKGERKGQPISNRENTENLFPLLLRSDLSAKVDLYGLFEFADKDKIC